MLTFCTLFDHNYLSRGLALYQSLKEQCCKDSFKLYILAIDDIAYEWLIEQKYENIVVQSLNDIKSIYPILNQLQKERSRGEFNWTLSSFSIQFFLRKFNLGSVTYLDADLFFYADPKILFDELENESVIITPHNYTPEYDKSATSGRYCVQFMYFKNDENGNKVLEWWRAACEECCCGTPTNGKFGDQKYLDDWLSRFPGMIHEEKHMGCGIAPWNIQQYNIIETDHKLYVQNKITKVKDLLIFYHFHGLRDYYDRKDNKWWDFCEGYDNFQIPERLNLYKNYISVINLNELLSPKKDKNLLIQIKPRFYLIKQILMVTIKKIIKAVLLYKTINEVKFKNLLRDGDL